jgi:hypothetical protein
MAKTILKNVLIEVDGTDLTERASSVTINTSADDVNVDTFGSDYHQHDRGLKEASITVTFLQDFAASQVDETLWPLSESGDDFIVTVADLDSPGSDPFSITAKLFDYQPISGSVGEASTTDVTFQNAGADGIRRTSS